MVRAKVAVTPDEKIPLEVDRLVGKPCLSHGSGAVEQAPQEKPERKTRKRLARECEKLDPAFEKELAEKGIEQELDRWPEY